MSIYLENLTLIRKIGGNILTRTNTQKTDWAGPTRTNTKAIPTIAEGDLSEIGKQYVSGPDQGIHSEPEKI